MMDWPTWALAILAYVVVQRLAELVYANANTRRLLTEGGREFGRGHYPLFILLHGSWLVAIAFLAQPSTQPSPWFLVAFIASQALRFWTLASIGRWWTTRIISAPSFPRVRKGPYRFISHPNYTVVVIEIALLPMLLGAVELVLPFTIANALLLAWRIRVEARVLAERRGN
jgi:methyltransferase